MKHLGNFQAPMPDDPFEYGPDCGSTYRLDDGTVVNVTTMAAMEERGVDTWIEASRKLTKKEQDAVLDADATLDHARGEKIEYAPLQVQHRF